MRGDHLNYELSLGMSMGEYVIYFIKGDHESKIDSSYSKKEAESKIKSWSRILDCNYRVNTGGKPT